jgi:hypothetical protein
MYYFGGFGRREFEVWFLREKKRKGNRMTQMEIQ